MPPRMAKSATQRMQAVSPAGFHLRQWAFEVTRIRRGLLAVGLSAMLLFGTATTAYAYVWVGGNKGCSANQLGKTRGYSWGLTYNYAPVSPVYSDVYVYDTGSTWKVGYNTASKTRGGYWEVDVYSGSISSSGSYATCLNSGTP